MVLPGVPHHVTRRGNRRLPVFFCDDDYRYRMALLSEWRAKAGTEVWAYCLMPNHVHLILLPDDEDGLRAALGGKAFFKRLEKRLGRDVRPRKPGRPARQQS